MSGKYDFKSIRPVPSADDFVDIVLSKTQRKTPTVVHQGYQIGRIRAFYMRKVKFTAESFVEKLGWILEDFPKLDDIHPFYGDLCNVLYDRDHYKLALGQLNVAKSLISTTSRDYARLLKYGDSLYRCKQLKRAALGRMCTLMKKHKSSLGYLEEVRKHLSRLPSIDPSTRTLLITGYPNVGKSSFMNKVTRADVEVQPYAFTTKSLYVGHMDYKYLRWQVLDTPGILDKPLEERNTIEMQAITALAHLQCCVMYFVDLSEQCGWTLEQQVALFDNIRPLFANKPLVIVANKIDLVPFESLSEAHRELLDKMVKDSGAELLTMSAAADMNIADVKQRACELLLERRVEMKAKSKKAAGILNRLTVAMPAARDGKDRPAFIPEGVIEARARKQAMGDANPADDEDGDVSMDGNDGKKTKKTLHQLEQEAGGPGHISFDYRRYYELRKDEFKYDVIPEIVDGKNIADFIDVDIMQKLEALEREEEERAAREEAELQAHEDAESDMDEEEKDFADRIRKKKALVVAKHREDQHKKRGRLSRKVTNATAQSAGGVQNELEEIGYDAATVEPETSARGRKRERTADPSLEAAEAEQAERDSRGRSISRTRVLEREAKSSLGTVDRAINANKRRKSSQRGFQLKARAGEADRHVVTKMPKHLFSGKRGIGKTQRR
ncbi:Nucleolar GTP-binding protein 1 [Hondaea fermentalgiana]|uniref:Nucleolar GTP-binding protein 1 n=1 Tax=Hondaea fermentalgiana TaxID=2315210 RepID=A0A2R5GV20_9STRA|nr:Nucleolar GTP-binding protein 1 [Hondaea fermentalgiana]|eukprot:GBG32241.1 Nucleolar GTP-binding protein 1 [Hondaea fermentalgiana]